MNESRGDLYLGLLLFMLSALIIGMAIASLLHALEI